MKTFAIFESRLPIFDWRPRPTGILKSKIENRQSRILPAALFLLAAATLQAQTWSVAYLHPAGADQSQLTATTGTQQAGYTTFGAKIHASIWAGSAATFTDLSPSAVATKAYANATNGAQQAGYTVLNGVTHAGIWAGSAATFTDLNPAVASNSFITSIAGNQQAGSVEIAGKVHAGIWAGTAISFVDLTPDAVATKAYINATSGNQQAGYTDFNGVVHAAIWAGVPGFTDLNPAGANRSEISSTTGTQQAGYATFGLIGHAGIWAGTAASFTDLHPASATGSSLTSTTGIRQAGYVITGANIHAGIWAGTAASFTDLHAFLSADYSDSQAQGIWSDGSVILVAGFANNAKIGRLEAVLWKLTPNRLPTIRISGKKNLRTSLSKLVIKGTADDADGALVRVEVKVGKAKYKKASGTTKWKFTARLEPGKNKILVRAVDAAGAASPPAKLTIIRQ